VPTVEELWRAVFPGARLTAPDRAGQGTAALGRTVAWVRVLKARTPAFDVLEADDLALAAESTLRSLAGLAVEPAAVAEALANAGASGLVVVGDAGSDGHLVGLTLEQAARLGLASFSLAGGDVSALERSAIGYVVNGRAELEQRAAALETQLEHAALSGAGVDGLAATIARFLARPTAIEGLDGAPLAVHAPIEAADEAHQVTEYLRRRRGTALRAELPGAGWLVLLGSLPPSELERVVAGRAARFLALLLGRATDASASALERAAGGLPADGPPWVVLLARQVVQDHPQSLEQRERVRSELRTSEPARRLALRGDATSVELRMVAAPGPADPGGLAIADRLSRRLGRVVAVSPPFEEPTERALVEAQARATLDAFEALPLAERDALATSDGGTVARTDLAPAYRLAAGVTALTDAQRHSRQLLAPILSGRPSRDRRTLATLRALLDHVGLAEAAAALGIHRNTLAYRVDRIESRTGWKLSDPLLRFSLSVAVRVVQNAQVEDQHASDKLAYPAV